MSNKIRILTGITTTGSPHLGNYVGAIRPAIGASQNAQTESFFFLADYHALVKCHEPDRVHRSTLEIAASWLAAGLDAENVFFYRQSDIPEIPELTWFLTCVAGKGLLNRSHAYKAAVDQNLAANEDADAGINMGLFNYPILMAADILVFNAHQVPVGKDQIQHIEMARDMGQRFNHIYAGDYFVLPEAVVDENTQLLPGLDGRKMSKSYDNTIPLWLSEAELRKAIMGIVTNSQAPGEVKDPDTSHIFTIYQAFANPAQTAAFRKAFAAGIAWGDAKQQLFEIINTELTAPRAKYLALLENPAEIERVLKAGAERARERSRALLTQLRHAVGLRPLTASLSAVSKTTSDESSAVAAVDISAPFAGDEKDQFFFKLRFGRNLEVICGPFSSRPDAGRASKYFSAEPEKLDLRIDPSTHAVQWFVDGVVMGRMDCADKKSAEQAIAKLLEAIAAKIALAESRNK